MNYREKLALADVGIDNTNSLRESFESFISSIFAY